MLSIFLRKEIVLLGDENGMKQKESNNIPGRLHQAIKESEYKNVSRVARRLDVDRKTVDKWTKGETSPTTQHVATLCAILHVSPNWLILGEGTKNEIR